MSVEKVKKYLEDYGMADRVLVFDVSSATVDLAAQALGCEPGRIAKTMSFRIEDKVALIVVLAMRRSTTANSRITSTPRPRCSPATRWAR